MTSVTFPRLVVYYGSFTFFRCLSYTIGIDQDTSAPRQFGTSPKWPWDSPAPKKIGAEVSGHLAPVVWCRSVLVPKCPDTMYMSGLFAPRAVCFLERKFQPPSRTLASSLPGTSVFWNIRFQERIDPGSFVTWNFRSQEYALTETPWHWFAALAFTVLCVLPFIVLLVGCAWFLEWTLFVLIQ